MDTKLAGIVGAPVTPFTTDNKVDHDTFAKQVNFLVENGVTALAHPMHIGESLNLTTEERKDLAGTLVSAAQGRVPTFVHVSTGGTDLAIDLAEHSAKVGSTGIVLMAPYHWKPEPDVIIEHFVATTAAHGGQLIAYNNPGATGVALTPAIFQALVEQIPGFVALKDASFHMETFTDYCMLAEEAARPQAIYTGIEHLLTSVPVGGKGAFSACAEVAPGLVRRLYEACATSNIAQARPLQYKTRRLLGRLMRTYPSTIKYAMELMGRPVGITRRPIRQLTTAEKEATRKDLQELGIFDNEPHGWSRARAPERMAS
jgi:4-hydroxy-tetrahydrodipicolinate synthase